MAWDLAGYVADELIGYGSTSEVWRGHRVEDGELVALKRIPLEGAGLHQAARAEAALLTVLEHPHLLRLHEVVSAGPTVTLVLDLAAGGSLADLLSRRGLLSAGEVVTAVAPVAAALAYAHADTVVHGDVSASNLLFSSSGLPLLADLGVARIVGEDRPTRSTPAYIDPDLARGGRPTPSSDVFMLAAVALHALIGEPIWPGYTAEEMIANAVRADLADLDERLARVPSRMRAVLVRALAPMSPLRGTAAELALDLRHCEAPRPVELSAGRTARTSERSAAAGDDLTSDDPTGDDPTGDDPTGDDPTGR